MTSTEVEVYQEESDLLPVPVDEIEAEAEVEAEVVPALTKTKAKQLDKRIRSKGAALDTNAEEFANLLEDAAIGQIHVGLGLKSWTAYVQEVGAESKFLQLVAKNKVERKALAVKMSDKGMSQRTIAGVFGVSQKTIDRDLDGEEFENDEIEDISGRKQPRNKSKAKDDENVIDAEIVEPDEPAKPSTGTELLGEFDNEVAELHNAIAAIKEIMAEQNWKNARKRASKAYVNDLGVYINDLTEVLDDLMTEA